MRRFELVDDSSNKFWSIEEKDSSFTVIYGRIGTDGREQTKSFDSAEEATKAAAKLIASKVKKGYLEVGGDAAKSTAKSAESKEKAPPAKPPATPAKKKAVKAEAQAAPNIAEPAPASPVDYSTPFLAWTDDLRSRVLAQRGMDPPKRGRPAIKPSALFKEGINALSITSRKWEAGEAAAEAEGIALMKRVRARLAGEEPAAFDALLEVACLKLTIDSTTWEGNKKAKTAERAIYFWKQRYGVPAAAEALVAMGRVRFITHDANRKPAPRFQVLASGYQDSAHHGRYHEAWEALRRIVAFADADEYEATNALLRSWCEPHKGNTFQGLMAAFVLSEEKDLRARVLGYSRMRGAWGVMALPTNVEEAKQALQLANFYIIQSHLQTFIWRVGIEALPLLLARAPKNHDTDAQRAWVRAMRVFVGVEPARAMVRYAEAKSVRPLLATYFDAYPDLGRLVLPDAINATKKKAPKEALKAMLQGIEMSNAEVAAPAGPIATQENLPGVLQAPPWRTKRPKPSAKQIDLKALDIPAELVLDETERNAIAARSKRFNRPPDKKHLDAAVAGEARAYTFRVAQVQDDDEMFDYIQRIKRWGWCDTDVLRSIVARTGARIAPYLPAMMVDYEHIAAAQDLAATDVAAQMAIAAFRAKTRRTARRWLTRFPRHAAAGLIPVYFGDDAKARKSAGNALRYLIASGHGEVVRQVGDEYGGEAAAEVAALVDANPLHDAPMKAPKLPPWVDVSRLPRARLLTGESLSEETTKHLVEMLAFSPADPPYAGVAEVHDALEEDSANELARALCSMWAAAGAKPVWKWAAHAVGHLGNDESARWLVGQINAWAADGSKSVAMAGLEALGMIGSNVALMPLARWSRKGRPWLKKGSVQVLESIAATRGLSPDELEDQTAPTLGLDEKGKLLLDYGPRQYTVTFDEQLQPRIFDSEGERVAKIPAARKTDDSEKAKEAKKTWKDLKKDAETLSKAQVERLERAMTTGRTWSVAEFEEYLVRHPLVGHLTRRLVFGCEHKNTLHTIRVSEDHAYATSSDDERELPSDARIRIVHPVHLPESELAEWGGIFADYEILQPFPQLGRTIHRPKNEDKGERILARAKGINAYTGRLFALRTRGWQLDGDPYYLDSARKELAPGITAWVSWEGGIDLERPKMQEHALRSVQLEGGVTLDHLDALAFSELVADIESLRGG